MERVNIDHEGNIQELDFSRLETGDMIVVDTKSGSTYRFSVSSNEDGNTLARLERRSDNAVKDQGDSPRWEQVDEDMLFRLVGSCRNITRTENGLVAVDTTDGHFVVGERAHIEAQINGEGGTLITTPIQAMQLEKPALQE